MNSHVAILCALLPLAGAWAAAPKPPTQNEWLAFLQERVDGLKGDKETWRRHIADDCIWVGLG